jgi:hypothetical protein
MSVRATQEGRVVAIASRTRQSLATTGGSENILDLSKKIKPNGWPVFSNPIGELSQYGK